MANNNWELVSVIVITYNSARTVEETIDSIKKQTYPNIEIVISDDCSSDNTVEIANRALHDYYNWQIVEDDKNRGTVSNVNKGVKSARGKYIKLIAGDDILLPNAIERYYHFFEDETICVSGMMFFGADKEVCNERKEYFEKRQFFYTLNPKEQFKRLLVSNPIVAPAVGIMKREFLERMGFFDMEYMMMEDYPFWIKCSKNGIVFKNIPEILVKYRVDSGSLSANRSSLCFESDKRLFWNVRFLELLKRGKIVTILKQLTYYLNGIYCIKSRIRRTKMLKCFLTKEDGIVSSGKE